MRAHVDKGDESFHRAQAARVCFALASVGSETMAEAREDVRADTRSSLIIVKQYITTADNSGGEIYRKEYHSRLVYKDASLYMIQKSYLGPQSPRGRSHLPD